MWNYLQVWDNSFLNNWSSPNFHCSTVDSTQIIDILVFYVSDCTYNYGMICCIAVHANVAQTSKAAHFAHWRKIYVKPVGFLYC